MIHELRKTVLLAMPVNPRVRVFRQNISHHQLATLFHPVRIWQDLPTVLASISFSLVFCFILVCFVFCFFGRVQSAMTDLELTLYIKTGLELTDIWLPLPGLKTQFPPTVVFTGGDRVGPRDGNAGHLLVAILRGYGPMRRILGGGRKES